MIHQMSTMEVLQVPTTNRIRLISRWMNEHDLALGTDWEYYGVLDNKHFMIGIKDKSKAMLFKLTWIGL